VRTDCLSLPFRSESADAVISIAVIHHLSSWPRRRKALFEMLRILKPGGRCLIYAWAMEQEKDSVKSTYLKQKGSNNCGNAKDENSQSSKENHVETSPILPSVLPVHKNRTNFAHSDLLVPWKLKLGEENGGGTETKEIFHRFYHVFREGELEQLIDSLNDDEDQGRGRRVKRIKSYYDQGNWCCIFQRIN